MKSGLLLRCLLGLSLFGSVAFGAVAPNRQSDVIETSKGPLKITPLYHGSVMLEFGGKIIHVDPWGQADYTGIPQADMVILSHSHADHMDPALLKTLRKEGSLLVAPPAVTDTLNGTVGDTDAISNGEKKTFLGVEIEAVAEKDPTAIVMLHVDPVVGISRQVAHKACVDAKLNPKAVDGAADILVKLYDCFTKGDCDLAEINPLIFRPDGGVHALDAKVSLDNNAAFRHPEWDEFRATEELDEREQLARTHDLQYIGLEGSVGIIANGAGLAMSTLDVVNQVGGKAANFLDIGGGANADVMAAALGVINFDENVKSIFINIFGGITRGEEVAKGIVEALSRVDLRAPMVIRLDGTNAEQGREILKNAGIPESKLISKPTMLEAARTAVAIANGAN